MAIRRFIPNSAMLCAALLLWAGLSGCSSISSEFNDLAQTLTPVTPPEAARMMLDQYDSDNRRRGTVLIATSDFGGLDQYVTYYRDMVENEQNPLVLAAAISALGRHGEPDDAILIARHLGGDHKQVRWAAARALQRLHNPSVIGALITASSSNALSADTRIAALIALGQYPQDRVFQAMVSALNDRQLSINKAAEWSLEQMTGQQLGFEAGRWLEWYRDTDEPFTDRQQYMYPTYQRNQTWLERLAFWTSPIREQPGIPHGMDPLGERRTYEDSSDG